MMTTSPATRLGRLSATLRPNPRTRQAFGARAFLIPIAIVIVVIFLIPLAQSFYFSLTDFNGYSPDLHFVGVDNYVRVFSDPSMVSSLGFTVLYAVSTLVFVTVLAIPLALVFNRVFFGRRFVQSALFFPAIPSLAIIGLVWGFIFNPLGSGALNSLLKGLFGISPIPWLSVDQLAQFSVVVVAIWSLTGWHAMLYLAYLQSIPHDFTEAAMMDGASARQRFFNITLPMLMPAVSVSSLLLLTSGIKVYELPYTLTKGGPGFATRTLTQSIIQSGVAQGKFGEGSALSVVFLVLVGSIVLAQLAIARRIEGRNQ